MAVILRDVLAESSRRYHLELIAGSGGLDRVMKWVYVSEDYSTADFLRGGELIITTGVISNGSAQWLLRFLRHIMQQDTCGLIINEGPYLRRGDITQEVLDLCDERRFPLLLMPWHIHIYDITRSFYSRIFADAQRDETVSGALRTLLDPNSDHAQALSVLPDYRFAAAAPYYVAAFLQKDSSLPPLPENAVLTGRFQSTLSLLRQPWALVGRGGQLFLVCQTGDGAIVRRAVQQLLEQQPQQSKDLCAGISGCAGGLEALARASVQAQAAAKMGAHNGRPLYRYEDMGFFKLLLEMERPDVLREYITQKLGPVREYDAAHHGAGLNETLYQYLLHGGNIQQVADTVFCHRNTIRNRVELLERLLNCSLEDPMARFELLCAYLGEEYLAVCGGPAQQA